MADKKEEHGCAERVNEGGRYGAFHMHNCSRKGVVFREGKWYCKQHDPVALKAKQDEKRKEYEAEWAKKRDERLRTEILAKLALDIPTEELANYKLVKKEK